VVITNNPDAGVIGVASSFGVESVCINDKQHSPYPTLDEAILEELLGFDVNLVVLAGYMKPVGQNVIAKYHNRILNIHPALLPKYGGKGMYGMNVHRAVIASNDKESGATIHLVDPLYDDGRILSQAKVERSSTDTPESLAEKVLRVEHQLYTQVLRRIQRGEITLD